MSSLQIILAWLNAGTPVWLTLAAVAACAWLYWQQRKLIRRLDNHAESIAHMDSWADQVEQAITDLEEKTKRTAPVYLPTRTQPADVKRWWQS